MGDLPRGWGQPLETAGNTEYAQHLIISLRGAYMYYVYVIANEKCETYIGYTGDLTKRLENHNSGGTKSTKGHIWHYVYYEAFADKEDAVLREKRLKSHGQSKRQLKLRIQRSIQVRK